MKKEYLVPAIIQIKVINILPLADSVTFSISNSERDADQAAARGGSFWDEGND